MQTGELIPCVEILRIREMLATVYLWNRAYLVITSRQQLGYLAPPELLSVQFYSSNERIKDLLYGAIEQTRRSKALEVKEFRHNLPSEIGKFLTSHLSEVQKIYKTRKNTLVEQTARDFEEYGLTNISKWSGSTAVTTATLGANFKKLLSYSSASTTTTFFS